MRLRRYSDLSCASCAEKSTASATAGAPLSPLPAFFLPLPPPLLLLLLLLGAGASSPAAADVEGVGCGSAARALLWKAAGAGDAHRPLLLGVAAALPLLLQAPALPEAVHRWRPLLLLAAAAAAAVAAAAGAPAPALQPAAPGEARREGVKEGQRQRCSAGGRRAALARLLRAEPPLGAPHLSALAAAEGAVVAASRRRRGVAAAGAGRQAARSNWRSEAPRGRGGVLTASNHNRSIVLHPKQQRQRPQAPPRLAPRLEPSSAPLCSSCSSHGRPRAAIQQQRAAGGT